MSWKKYLKKSSGEIKIIIKRPNEDSNEDEDKVEDKKSKNPRKHYS